MLSTFYPSITISHLIYDAFISHEKSKKEDKYLFKFLIQNIKRDDEFWANNNADDMFRDHKELLDACLS